MGVSIRNSVGSPERSWHRTCWFEWAHHRQQYSVSEQHDRFGSVLMVQALLLPEARICSEMVFPLAMLDLAQVMSLRETKVQLLW